MRNLIQSIPCDVYFHSSVPILTNLLRVNIDFSCIISHFIPVYSRLTSQSGYYVYLQKKGLSEYYVQNQKKLTDININFDCINYLPLGTFCILYTQFFLGCFVYFLVRKL